MWQLQQWRRYSTIAYFALAFAISWIAIILAVGIEGIPGEGVDIERHFAHVFLAMLAGPSIAGITMTALADGKDGLLSLWVRQRHVRVPTRWYGVALGTAPLLLLIILALLALFLSRDFVPAVLRAGDPLAVILLAVGGGLAAGMFEEIGWTGFATPHMDLCRRGIGASAFLGVVWMIWHLLGDYWGTSEYYGPWYALHVLGWFAALSAYRVLMTWVYSETESLFVAQLMHAAFTGGQVLLSPATLSPKQNLLWYGVFACALWLLVFIVKRMRDRQAALPVAPDLVRSAG